MRTKDPFRDGAEEMAEEFKRLAVERANEFWADEDPLEDDD